MKKLIKLILFILIIGGFITYKFLNSSFIGDMNKTADQSIKVYNNKENRNTYKQGDILILVNRDNPLPKDYIPSNLVELKVPFKENIKEEEKMMVKEAAKHLEDMFKAAKENDVNLYLASGYRTYDYQKKLYEERIEEVGLDMANKYVAQPGYSEHQTGLAADLTNSDGARGQHIEDFGRTFEGKWLKRNAYKYGFILRYPWGKENITGYNYEPWHVRYVGKKAARYINREDITFDEYMVKNN